MFDDIDSPSRYKKSFNIRHLGVNCCSNYSAVGLTSYSLILSTSLPRFPGFLTCDVPERAAHRAAEPHAVKEWLPTRGQGVIFVKPSAE